MILSKFTPYSTSYSNILLPSKLSSDFTLDSWEKLLLDSIILWRKSVLGGKGIKSPCGKWISSYLCMKIPEDILY